MTVIRVAAAAINQTPLDWDGNTSHILSAVEEARRLGAHVLCLPELCIPGYGCEDAFFADGVASMSWSILQREIAPATKGLIVSVGLPILHRGERYNCAALLVDGRLVGLVGKQNLAGDGLHYEPRWFRPWPNDIATDFVDSDGSFPLGDIVFDCGGIRLGFEICEDAWVLRRTGGDLARYGVDLILNPSASHFAFAKTDARQRLVKEGSRTFHAAYIYANLVGNEAGRAIYDGEALVAVGDTIVARGPRLGFRDVYLTTADVDVLSLRRERWRTRGGELDEELSLARLVKVPFEFPPITTSLEPIPRAAWEDGPRRKEEEFARAMSLGLFDYLRKSQSKGFVISLSGGADSAALATLVSTMIELAWRELGREGFLLKLAHVPELAACHTSRELTHRMLTCAYQSTRNSGAVTRQAASHVAQTLGANYLEFDIEPMVRDYVGMVEEALDRDLDWKTDDLALQNIQARARGPSVWMLANLSGFLLAATSNRSEAAVGYATMDGDTCGGLAPLAGIDKAFLRGWLVWMEESGLDGLAPHAELHVVNVQAPTAELRPPGSHQTDEADLMPYPVLDAIERHAIRDRLSPLECWKQVVPEFPAYAPGQLGIWVERFFRLWCRNQWKRERYAPSFHVDDKNLDPKTWCRFPILSGGFARELRALRQALDA